MTFNTQHLTFNIPRSSLPPTPIPRYARNDIMPSARACHECTDGNDITMRAAMNPLQPVNVAQYGIGPIGAEIARLLLTKPWVKLVAAVDIDPKKIGKDVGEVVGLKKPVGVAVTPDLQGPPEVVCHSTRSRLHAVASQ